MPESNDGYRGALDASYSRIAELERQLVEARAELARPADVRARIAELRRRRETLIATGARMESGPVRVLGGIGLSATVLFTVAMVAIGPSGHPFNAACLGLAVTGVLVLLGRLAFRRPLAAQRDALAKVDAELDALARLDPAAGVRVDAAPGAGPDRAADEREDSARETHGRRAGS